MNRPNTSRSPRTTRRRNIKVPLFLAFLTILIAAGMIVFQGMRPLSLENRSVPELLTLLQNPTLSEETRREAAVRLGAHGQNATQAVPALITAMQQETLLIQMAAIHALGQIGSTTAVPALIEELPKNLMNTREAAVQALAEIGPMAREAIPPLTRRCMLLGCQRVVEALERIDPDLNRVLEEVANLASSEAANDRMEAAAVLANLAPRHGAAIGPLAQKLEQDPDENVRKWAQAALQQTGLSAEKGQEAAQLPAERVPVPTELPAEQAPQDPTIEAAKEAYVQYNRALQTKDGKTALNFVPRQKARELEGLSPDQIFGKLHVLSPLHIQSATSQFQTEDRLELRVNAVLESSNLKARGVVQMLRENGQWKVAEERWDLE